MEYINCILFNEDNTEKIYISKDSIYNIITNESFPIVRCKRCGLIYINFRPTKCKIVRYFLLLNGKTLWFLLVFVV